MRKSPLRRQSKKASKQQAADARWADAVKAGAGWRCVFPGCGVGGVLEAHHVVSRRVAKWRHSFVNGVAVCPQHHAWIHGNPAMARELGFLGRSTDDPFEIAARRHG